MTPSNHPALQLSGLTKRFGNFTAVDHVDLEIADGEFFTLVGPSGSGKTTMLRMLVGMDQPCSGEMRLHGKIINHVPANKRPTCMVFQNLALFPHKSVGANIEFPLKIAGVDKLTRQARAIELLKQVKLPEDFYGKSVTMCSGGERQRVALARALAFDPEILLFDEPLSSLDFRLRKTLEKYLKDLHRETCKTFVYITHSLEEAMVMSDRIGIMREGKLVQVGSPHEIYNNPVNKFVAQFMGEINSIDVKRAGPTTVIDNHGRIFSTDSFPDEFETGILIIRPEVMKINKVGVDLDNKIDAQLYNDYPLGSRIQFQALTKETGEHWLVERLQDNILDIQLGGDVVIGWSSKDAILVQD